MKKIIYSLSFLILSAALPVAAFAADMHCFYKSSGKNIITVCKKDGKLYYDSLAAVLSEFVNNSGIHSGEAYNFSPVQDKNGDNPKVADYISKNLFAKLSHAGIKAAKDGNSEISAAFEIIGSNMEISFNVPDKNYSEKLRLLNAEAIKEDAEIYATAQPIIDCEVCKQKCPECTENNSNDNTVNGKKSVFAKIWDHKVALFVCLFVLGMIMLIIGGSLKNSGIMQTLLSLGGFALIILSGIGIIWAIWSAFANKMLISGIYAIAVALLWNIISKPTYPSNKIQIWAIIAVLVLGIVAIISSFMGIWGLAVSALLVIIFAVMRSKGIFKKY